MKKLFQVLLVVCICFGLAGCASKRKALSDSDVKDRLEKQNYKVSNLSSEDSVMSTFTNEKDKTAIIYSKDMGLCFLSEQSVYSSDTGEILTGDGDATAMEKKLSSILEKADVLRKEVEATLKKEYKNYIKKLEEEQKAEENKVYSVGERVVLAKDGKEYLAFTINSVKTTEERNEYSDKTPSQVIVINYSYENLAMDDDAFISSHSFTVVDGDGNVAETYPAGTDIYPQECPVGAKSEGEEAYGLKSAARTIKLRFSEYLPNEIGKVSKNFEIAF